MLSNFFAHLIIFLVDVLFPVIYSFIKCSVILILICLLLPHPASLITWFIFVIFWIIQAECGEELYLRCRLHLLEQKLARNNALIAEKTKELEDAN